MASAIVPGPAYRRDRMDHKSDGLMNEPVQKTRKI